MSFKGKMFLKLEDSADVRETLNIALKNGYSGLMTSIVNEQYIREHVDQTIASKHLCFTRSPLILNSGEWTHEIIPYLSPPNVAVNDEELHLNNDLQWQQETNFACHLKPYGYIVVKLTDQTDPEALGLSLKNVLAHQSFVGKILVELPMIDTKVFSSVHRNDKDETVEDDQWSKWQRFFAATGYHSNVEVALVMTPDLPSSEEIKRWLGANVGMLIIPHNCFVSNNSNFPILPQSHQKVFALFQKYTKSNVTIEPLGYTDNRIKLYAENIAYISNRNTEWNENTGHEDELRCPLQPLSDNLDFATYEVFEHDPQKYILYQRAIEAAMIDMIPEDETESKRLVLMVLGAGRGPLVRAAVNACKNTQRKLKILVVEKNPNAIVTLTSLINVMWPDEDITLISRDMRTLKLEEKADIIVSELLGSFGDNELSPECLDGAQSLLKENGISIPSNSKSYIRPVMSQKVYNMAQTTRIVKPQRDPLHYSNQMQCNWLSYLSNVYYIDNPKELFTFVHPNKSDPIDNSRYGKLKFQAKLDCTLHGISGYFTSKLYKDIEISIHPATHTKGMGSWYSMFFPLEQQLDLKAGEDFSVEFWRKIVPDKQVWYEWRVKDGPIYNEGGIYHPILLYSDN